MSASASAPAILPAPGGEDLLPPGAAEAADELMEVLRETVLALVRRDGRDLTTRQLSVLLLVHLCPGPHTVRGLAAELHVSKPAITRALDRLAEAGLTQRADDPHDRRSVLVVPMPEGRALVRFLRDALADAARAQRGTPAT